MAVKIQWRRGTAAEWSVANPLLAEGESGFELDTLKWKVGDGVRNWASLPYSSGIQGPTGPTGPPGEAEVYEQPNEPAGAGTGALWIDTDEPDPAPASGTVINVKAYGAVGDGTTDDTAAIQAALDALPAVGGEVVFPSGTYLMANLVMTSQTNVTLSGAGTLKRKPTGGVPDANGVATFNACEDVRLTGLRIDLNNLERYGGLIFYGCDGVWVDGCHVFDSNLNPSWTNFDHYALVCSTDADSGMGCSNVWITGSLFEECQVEVDNTRGFHIEGNTSRRAAGTMAIGCFAISGGESLLDGQIVNNVVVDPRQAGIVVRHDPGGLSNQTWRNLLIAQNTIRHDTTVANAGIAPVMVGNLTGITTGSGNVRENIRVIDNIVWVDADLAARSTPAVLWMDNAVAAGQDFRKCELSRNRVIGPRSGEWSFDIRRLVDSDVVGNVARGVVTHGMSFDNFSGCRIKDNRSEGTALKLGLTNSNGGNWISENEQLGAPPTKWAPSGVASDLINP